MVTMKVIFSLVVNLGITTMERKEKSAYSLVLVMVVVGQAVAMVMDLEQEHLTMVFFIDRNIPIFPIYPVYP
jgi:hypothetical protein